MTMRSLPTILLIALTCSCMAQTGVVSSADYDAYTEFVAMMPPVPDAMAAPTMPQRDTNSPPRTHPPMPKTMFSAWEDGRIVELEPDRFYIMAEQYQYRVEWTPDLTREPWQPIGAAVATNSLAEYIHANPDGFYRVIKRRQPVPPYGVGNFGNTDQQKPVKGYFRKVEK